MLKSIYLLTLGLALSITPHSASYAQKPHADELYYIYIYGPEFSSEKVNLMDGVLMIRAAEKPKPDLTMEPYLSTSRSFQIQHTKDGTLIRLHPKGETRQEQRNLKLEGFYLTADYATEPPTLKYTENPEKNSYWKVAKPKEVGPLVNVNDTNKPIYLSVDRSAPIPRASPSGGGYGNYWRLNLSDRMDYKFRIDTFDLDDDGK